MTQEEGDIVSIDQLDDAAGGEQGTENDLEDLVEAVVANLMAFSDDQVEDMMVALQERGTSGVEYDSSFDLQEFIQKQVRQLELMRVRLMSQRGNIRVTASERGLKDLMAASKTLTDTILKHQKTILDFKRIQVIESATREAMEEVDPELVNKFVEALERLLAAQDE